MASERIVAASMGMLTIFLVARFMGPVDLGIFTFAFATIGLGLTAGQLGMDSLLVRCFVNADWTEGEIIGTAVLLKAMANVVGFAAVLMFVLISTDGETPELKIILLGASVFALSSITTVLNPLFMARKDFKSLFKVRVIATAVSLFGKIIVVASDLSIVAMASAHIMMFVIETIILFELYRRKHGLPLRAWVFNESLAMDLVARGLPLFIGTLIAVTYLNIDMIMLRLLWDARAVGEYALVPQMLNALQIIPYALTSVAFPAVLAFVKIDNHTEVTRICRRLYSRLVLLAIVGSFFVIFVVRPLTPIVFGEAYHATMAPLLISAFTIPLVFIRYLSTKLIVAYDVRYDFVKMELAGLVVNIGLNLILIPLYAGTGAAISTLAAYFTSTIIMSLMLRRTRAIFMPMLKGYTSE